MSNPRLLITDTHDNIHVNLPSGKLTKSGERKPLDKQKGMTCLLYATRRIAFFSPEDKNSDQRQAYKLIKNRMTNYDGNTNALIAFGNNICIRLGIDVNKALLGNVNFMKKHEMLKTSHRPLEYYHALPSQKKWNVLYNVLIENVIAPVMHLKYADWQPDHGFAGLKASLQQNGAHFFIGKFGSCFYTKSPVPFLKETTPDRQVFTFDKDCYAGKLVPYTHSIIVDQVKVVSKREMVFFRDPNKPSAPSQPEYIYMLSFPTFVERLRNTHGGKLPSSKNADCRFGMVSTCPEKLLGPTTK